MVKRALMASIALTFVVSALMSGCSTEFERDDGVTFSTDAVVSTNSIEEGIESDSDRPREEQ